MNRRQQQAEKARSLAHVRQGGPSSFFQRLSGLWPKGLGTQAGFCGVLALAVVFLAFPAPVDYQVGQVAENTIRADSRFQYLDQAATDIRRLEAADRVPPVFILDDLLSGILERQAEQLFQRAREIPADGAGRLTAEEPASLKHDFMQLFNLPDDSPVWPGLLERGFPEVLEKQALSLVSDIMAHGFLDEFEPDDLLVSAAAVTVINLSTRTEYVASRLDAIIGHRELHRILDIRARRLAVEYDRKETELILALAQGLVRPNLKPDQRKTQARIRQAAAEVSDIYVDVRPGQVIAQEGTVIDQETLVKIKTLEAGQIRQFHWLSRFSGLFLTLFLFYNLIAVLLNLSLYDRLFMPPARTQVFLGLILVLTALAAHLSLVFGTTLSWDFVFVDNHTIFFAMPLPAAAMLAAVFFGLRQALLMLIVIAATVTVVLSGEGRFVTVLFYVISGGIVGALSLRNMNERKDLVPASIWVILVNCLTLLSLTLYSDTVWGRQTANNLLAAAACGFFSGILTSGLIPLVEITFGYNTNFKMLELGNLDRPLLRGLMLSAPGTYHHSVIVGTMVEAAAEAIGANAYVAKVGAYYHDIGKTKKPQYFVENQSGENRHDTLSPSMSALVLVGHVREGAELGRAHQLPQVIIDIIEQHHGVSIMGYFHHKALELHQPGQPEVNEGDFRYPGPKPRSAEAGLVMLGDVCEAATRSLAEPTPLKIRNLVQSVVNQLFSDGQLDECELKTSDVAVVINTFTNILIGIYHHRVPYPRKRDSEAGQSAVREAWAAGSKPKDPAYARLPVEPPKSPAH